MADRIYEEAIIGVLRGRTVVMVTNDVNVGVSFRFCDLVYNVNFGIRFAAEYSSSFFPLKMLPYRLLRVFNEKLIISLQRLARCDQIILLEAGRVIVQGSHEELLQQSPVYANYCREASQNCEFLGLSKYLNHTLT